MSIVQTVLVFAGIPIAIIGVVAFAVYGRTLLHQPNRYRPGRAWNYPPSWFLPHPEALAAPASALAAIEGRTEPTVAVGGASGEW